MRCWKKTDVLDVLLGVLCNGHSVTSSEHILLMDQKVQLLGADVDLLH
jgi:hypothetical protein